MLTSALCTFLFHLILTPPLRGMTQHLHFINEETEAERMSLIFPSCGAAVEVSCSPKATPRTDCRAQMHILEYI